MGQAAQHAIGGRHELSRNPKQAQRAERDTGSRAGRGHVGAEQASRQIRDGNHPQRKVARGTQPKRRALRARFGRRPLHCSQRCAWPRRLSVVKEQAHQGQRATEQQSDGLEQAQIDAPARGVLTRARVSTIDGCRDQESERCAEQRAGAGFEYSVEKIGTASGLTHRGGGWWTAAPDFVPRGAPGRIPRAAGPKTRACNAES